MNERAEPQWTQRPLQWWWVQLPLRIARFSSHLGNGLTDGLYLIRWPIVAVFAPVAVIFIGLLLGIFHPGETYTQSLIVMGLLLSFGLLSVQLGFWGVIGFALGDFLLHEHAASRFGILDSIFRVRVPLILSYFLLGLAVVIIPLVGASIRLGIKRQQRLPVAIRVVLETAVYIIVTALLIYLWANATAVMIRPVFTWRGSQPPVAAISPLQEQGWMLALITTGIIIVRRLLETQAHSPRVEKFATILNLAFPLVINKQKTTILTPPISWGLGAFSLTLLLAGMISNLFEAIIVFLFFAGLLWGRHTLQNSSWSWLELLTRIPVILRFGLGLLLNYYLTRFIVGNLWNVTNTFLPVLISTCLSIAILTLLTVIKPVESQIQSETGVTL